MSVTPLYAAFFGFLLVALSWHISRLRTKYTTARMNEEGHSEMTAATRALGHLTETIPIALLLMALAESLDTSLWVLHGLGVLLLVARLAHLKGLKDPSGKALCARQEHA